MNEDMGQKDLTGKLLEDYEDVFSDIFNVLLFEKNVIKQQYLRAGATESIYKAENGNYRDQFRDVIKEYTNCCLLEIASLGIENQSSLDKYISVRVMGYDYTKYRNQIDREKYPLLPVLTIVLNFSDVRWNVSKSLHSIMEIPKEFKAYVQDYRVKVFDIAFLEDEVIERFTSDFKIVAKFFKNKRLGKLDSFGNDKIIHIQELMDFLSVFSGDNRYKDIKVELMNKKAKGESITMCIVIQTWEEKGIKKERLNAIQRMLRRGYSKEDILGWEYTEEEYMEAESIIRNNHSYIMNCN